MTRIEALKELAAKVEAGEFDAVAAYAGFPKGAIGTSQLARAVEAFHGDLNAAKALHEAVLPGWTRAVDATLPEAGICVTLYAPDDVFGDDYTLTRGDDMCEPRAWLLAILRALIAQEGSEP